MTDNTQELDGILFNLCDLSYASFTTQEEADSVANQLDYDRAEAKQAIISLIKELVAEAKPEKRELIEPVTGKPVSRGDKVTFDVEADPRGSLIFVQNNGYNMALNQFEQNLLKALEEK